MPHEPVLLIDHGDLPSLVAAVTQPDPSRLILWHLRGHDPAARRRLEAVERHRLVLDAFDLIVSDAWDAGAAGSWTTPEGMTPATGVWSGLGATLVLVQAALVAGRHGCSKIVWPIQVGPDPEQVAMAVECAASVGDLAALGGGAAGETVRARPDDVGGETLIIDLPLVDLDDEQIVDLADDCGAPARDFWPCEGDAASPCPEPAHPQAQHGTGTSPRPGAQDGTGTSGGEAPGACPGCARWQTAFRAFGLAWPWTPQAQLRHAAGAATHISVGG